MKYFPKKLPAFSLIEVSIALVVMGLIMGGALKGKQLLRTARLNHTVQQMQHLQSVIAEYHDAYQDYPGDQPLDQKKVWEDIYQYEGREVLKTDTPSAKVGGKIELVHDQEALPGYWLKLTREGDQGALTPSEARIFLSKNEEHSHDSGHVRVLNDGNNQCLNGNELDFKQKDRVCIVAVEVLV
jgi:prepilin-type N-terminal cleavage/methylation domain-containing protein